MALVTGDNNNNNLNGTSDNDILRGFGGDDTLQGLGGNDALNGGLGADVLDGGPGFDFADYRQSASGLTVSLANPSANTGEAVGDTYISIFGIFGSNFNDVLIGDADTNFLLGGQGGDQLDGGGGSNYADYLLATTAVTVSLANPASNTGEAAGDTFISIGSIRGGQYNDTLIGNASNNNLRGGLGADTLDGGAGFDLADYDNSTQGLTVSLANPASNTGEAAGDVFVSIEGIYGTAYADILIGDGQDNILNGNVGADSLDGGAGFDFASYYNSSLVIGVTASLATPSINTGEAFGDTYISIEGLQGTQGADTLIGDAQNNFLRGREGADTLNGGGGFDSADYRTATTGLTVSLANPASNTGEAAGDTYISIENIRGGDFADSLTGDANNNVLRGGLGADRLDGGAGFDFASYTDSTTGLTVSLANPSANTGEAAGDTYISIEALRGSNFGDNLTGNGEINHLRGGLGADRLDGGGSFDFADYADAVTAITASLANSASNTNEAAGDTYISIEGLIGSGFADTLIGDANGNFLRGNSGADVLIGNGGFDYAGYYNATSGITANLANAAANTGEAAGDTYNSIEGLQGGAFNDTLIGDAQDNFLRGEGGADSLDGGAGLDFADYFTPLLSAGVTVSLATPAINTGDAVGDTYTSIEGLQGTEFADTLIGDALNNVLRGRGGADILNGGGGTDFADYGLNGTGVTVSLANPAANTGDAAGDSYISIEGLSGTEFNDTLTAGNGRYVFLQGGLGADTLTGGPGFDWADYSRSTVGLTVSLANSAANTGEAAGDIFNAIDNIRGSKFSDTLIGDTNGNYLRGGLGADSLDGGGGTDVADYNGSSIGITVSLANPGSNTGEAMGDTFTSIEGLGGSDFADRLIGDAGNNVLLGRGGADILDGGSGGNDTAIYDYGSATAGVTASLANPSSNTGDALGDSYISIENLSGTVPFDDTLIGDDGGNVLQGLGGNDTLKGGGGADTLIGGIGNDILDGGTNPEVRNASGQITGGSGDFLLGGDGNDTYYVDSSLDFVDEGSVFPQFGFGGNDTIISTSDFFWDLYSVGETLQIASNAVDIGNDGTTIVGGVFNNTLIGNAGTNVMFGRGGSDVYKGGDGIDFISLSTLGVPDAAGYTANGNNTVVVDQRTSGPNSYDIVFEFESGKDKLDVSSYHYANVADVLARGVNDGAGNSYFVLGDGLDYLYMVGLTTTQISAGDFII